MDEALKALTLDVIDSIDDSDCYDIYTGGKLTLTNVTATEASSFIMKYQRKVNSLLGANQRQLDYVQRWQKLSQSHSEANKNKR